MGRDGRAGNVNHAHGSGEAHTFAKDANVGAPGLAGNGVSSVCRSSVKSREWHIGETHAVRLLHFGPIRGEPSRSGLRLKAPGTKKNRAENPNAYQRSTKGNSG